MTIAAVGAFVGGALAVYDGANAFIIAMSALLGIFLGLILIVPIGLIASPFIQYFQARNIGKTRVSAAKTFLHSTLVLASIVFGVYLMLQIPMSRTSTDFYVPLFFALAPATILLAASKSDSLPSTYWGLWIIGGAINGQVINQVLDFQDGQLKTTLLVICATFLCASALITWRAASNYRGARFWPILAKLSVSAGVIISTLALIALLRS